MVITVSNNVIATLNERSSGASLTDTPKPDKLGVKKTPWFSFNLRLQFGKPIFGGKKCDQKRNLLRVYHY